MDPRSVAPDGVVCFIFARLSWKLDTTVRLFHLLMSPSSVLRDGPACVVFVFLISAGLMLSVKSDVELNFENIEMADRNHYMCVVAFFAGFFRGIVVRDLARGEQLALMNEYFFACFSFL